MAIPRQAVEAQALPADHALDQPLGGHQRDFLGRHVLLQQRGAAAVRHHHVELARRKVCVCVCGGGRRRAVRGVAWGGCGVGGVGRVPEASGCTCRTDEAPPMVTSWAHSSVGFSNTSRTRRALKGLQRGCLVGTDQHIYRPGLGTPLPWQQPIPGRRLTIPRWRRRAPSRRAAGSSCS